MCCRKESMQTGSKDFVQRLLPQFITLRARRAAITTSSRTRKAPVSSTWRPALSKRGRTALCALCRCCRGSVMGSRLPVFRVCWVFLSGGADRCWRHMSSGPEPLVCQFVCYPAAGWALGNGRVAVPRFHAAAYAGWHRGLMSSVSGASVVSNARKAFRVSPRGGGLLRCAEQPLIRGTSTPMEEGRAARWKTAVTTHQETS